MRAQGLKIVLGASLLAAFSAGIVAARAEASKAKALKVANSTPVPSPPPPTESWTILQPESKDAKGFSVVKPGEMADNFGGHLSLSSSSFTGGAAAPSSGSGGNASANGLTATSRIAMPKF